LRRYSIVLVMVLSLVACGEKQLPPAPPLTDFSCQLSLVDVPSEMKVGGKPVAITVKVVNTSAAAWPAKPEGKNLHHEREVNIAYHWNRNGGDVMEGDRAFLPADLASKQSAEVQLAVFPPSAEGNYVLRVEPVQESVGWFAARGGCKAQANVKAIP
jgi:hypothetical protein